MNQRQQKICETCSGMLNQVDELQQLLKTTVKQLDEIEQQIIRHFNAEIKVFTDCIVIITEKQPMDQEDGQLGLV